jgi:hypothetical protein
VQRFGFGGTAKRAQSGQMDDKQADGFWLIAYFVPPPMLVLLLTEAVKLEQSEAEDTLQRLQLARLAFIRAPSPLIMSRAVL